MEAGILLKKLIDSDNKDSLLYKSYQDSLNSGFTTLEEAFDTCIEDLKKLSDAQYDFDWLTKEAPLLGIKRNDCRDLCDHLCFMLGAKIEDLCYKPVFTKSSNYDNCPIRADLVMYCKHPFAADTGITSYDRDNFTIISSKLEETPYYKVYIHEIEKI